MPKEIRTEVWALLYLCQDDRERVHDFFKSELGIDSEMIVRGMHITVYHARRPMLGVMPLSEKANVVVNSADTRFMVMAPGGEEPSSTIEPGHRKVGIRIRKSCGSCALIKEYRERLLQYETAQVLGGRRPSTNRRNAFGARYFQPHMVILLAGNGIQRDLTPIGTRFREVIGHLRFDRFKIRIARNVVRQWGEEWTD